MQIEIEKLSYDELQELNRRVVERINYLYSVRAQGEMSQFSPGDQVSFDVPGRGVQFGTLVKYNKKTVTVITEDRRRWNVAPRYLTRVKPARKGATDDENIIQLPAGEP